MICEFHLICYQCGHACAGYALRIFFYFHIWFYLNNKCDVSSQCIVIKREEFYIAKCEWQMLMTIDCDEAIEVAFYTKFSLYQMKGHLYRYFYM